MWPRVGGHVGPPTPITPEVDRFELMPWRSPPPADQIRAANALSHVSATRTAAQSASPPYLATSCVLTSYIFTLSPPFPCPLQMRMDSFSSPRRTFQRMYRRIQHPYRLLSLSERMHIYRPILPSLQEEESTEQRPTVVLQEQRQSRTSKRRTRSISSYNPSTEQPADIGQSTQMHSPSLPRSASNQWLRQSQWPQPDEPEIIITSDVQLQTDDEQTGFVSSGLLSASLPPGPPYQELPIEYEPPSVQTVNEATPMSSEDNNVSAELTTDYLEIEVIENESYVSYNAYEVPVTEVYYQPTQMETNGMELVAQQSDVVESSTSNGDATGSVETAQNRSLKDLSPVVSFELYTRKTMPVLPAATPAAKQVANKMIKHARNNKTLDEKLLHCLNCDLFPILPVTGYCGHTRCTRCIEENGDCPCGAEAPTELHVNTVVQYLLGKMLPNENYVRRDGSHERPADVLEASSAAVKKRPSVGGTVRPRRSRGNRSAPMRVRSNAPCDVNARMPMSPQVQFEYARRLLLVGRYRDAAPHLARVAASCESLAVARNVRMLLSQVIVLLADGSDPRRIARDLLRSVRLQGASSWLKPSDLECVLCYHTYTKPITTPCGHTYCRTCIERALDYRKACALCMRPLEDFDVTQACENVFVGAALESIDASSPPQPPEPDVIPIFVCTVAYPSIPCPLFIFDPRYWLMIRRVLESSSRKFGMVAYERDRNYSDYGTVLEVCDCVHLEDGRSFLSTIGVSRFKLIERDVRDGCDVARIQPLTDLIPTEGVLILNLRMLSSQILYKALMWLNNMNKTVRTEIENAFGQIPRADHEQDEWWDSPDGPAWLWWLIAILPLRSEIKVLILSTKSLLKRMMAVSRTLEAIDQVAITTTSTSECEIRSALTNADEWLERGS
ncbi:uncharacterized protein LOC114351961 isoform X1 [Ostrinia furnacalis]|uniref:uncharacterized protein LOC114351961 isoform X1 n=2 Tax=Ostrinia furnacalis TaxID=93504 RepID=UPI001038CFF5|nr:uncharacterized protein LOC114351961 isoform X1 [Ostrinia furnacalis]